MKAFANRELVGFFCFVFLQPLVADAVYSEPTFSTEWDSITVYFDATEGDQGLMGYTGDVWAHAGVITVNSSNSTDWKYVKTNWGQNTNDRSAGNGQEYVRFGYCPEKHEGCQEIRECD